MEFLDITLAEDYQKAYIKASLGKKSTIVLDFNMPFDSSEYWINFTNTREYNLSEGDNHTVMFGKCKKTEPKYNLN